MKQYRLSIITAVIAVALITTMGFYTHSQVKAHERNLENQYRRALCDLTDAVRSIDVALAKGAVTVHPKHLARISNEINQYAAYAKACLGQLPAGDAALNNTQKFLSQVGDYALMLSSNAIDENPVTPEQHATLLQLSGYAHTLFQTLNEADLSGAILSQLNMDERNAGREQGFFSDMETHFQEYPSLIYDGPFSDHLERQEPIFLKGKPVVSQQEALEKAQSFLQDGLPLTASGESDGTIPCYHFSSEADDRSVHISVAKQGGYVVSMLDTIVPQPAEISYEEGIGICREFLQQHGFSDFKDSYYEQADGVMTVNFAATQGALLLYPDLIKLKVAADTKKVIGFEAKGYLSHHHDRPLTTPSISAEEAQEVLNPYLTPEKINLCYIPTEAGTELFCYEIKGSFEDKHYLVYVNAQTGREEKILLILNQENGVLTM